MTSLYYLLPTVIKLVQNKTNTRTWNEYQRWKKVNKPIQMPIILPEILTKSVADIVKSFEFLDLLYVCVFVLLLPLCCA